MFWFMAADPHSTQRNYTGVQTAAHVNIVGNGQYRPKRAFPTWHALDRLAKDRMESIAAFEALGSSNTPGRGWLPPIRREASHDTELHWRSPRHARRVSARGHPGRLLKGKPTEEEEARSDR